MSLKIHGDNKLYWQYQYDITEKYLLPLLKGWGIDFPGLKVLEIGAGEGGIVACLADKGAKCAALEYDPRRAEIGRSLTGRGIDFIAGDICRKDEYLKLGGRYDFIMFRDVLEHLEDKPGAMANISALMDNDALLLLETCPWYMPFGGHQQILTSFMGKTPFIHLFPRGIYFKLMRKLGESEEFIEVLESVYRCRHTSGQVYSLVRQSGLEIIQRRLYMLNPSYKIRFGWPVVPGGFIGRIPLLRDFLISSIYLLLRRRR